MMRFISYTTSDGIKLTGTEYKPKQPKYTLLFVLGFGGTGIGPSHFFQECAKQGFHTFVYTNRGHHTSEGVFYMNKFQDDVKKLITHHKKLSKLPFVVAGNSLGATMAANALPKVDYLVSYNPFIDAKYINHKPKRLLNLHKIAWLIRPIALLIWNKLAQTPLSTNKMEHCRLTHNFKQLAYDILHIEDFEPKIPPHKPSTAKALLVLSTGDTLLSYTKKRVRTDAFNRFQKLFSKAQLKVIPKLTHEFGDDHHFMNTDRMPELVSLMIPPSK